MSDILRQVLRELLIPEHLHDRIIEDFSDAIINVMEEREGITVSELFYSQDYIE
jgi:hypothetical protein